jgi:hypothetical protein
MTGILRFTVLCCCLLLGACSLSSSRGSHLPVVEHVVQHKGETLGAIAAWYAGDAKHWKAIATANPGRNPNAVELGDTVLIPRSLVVREGPFTRDFLRAYYGKRRKRKEGHTFQSFDLAERAKVPSQSVQFAAGHQEVDKGKPSEATQEPVAVSEHREELLTELFEE